jgi:4-oxalocrotonate tautomerase
MTEAINAAITAPISIIRSIKNEMPKQHLGIAGDSAKKIGK